MTDSAAKTAQDALARRRPARPRAKAPAGALGELRLLRQRGGAALGEAYARAARAVFHRLERLEDLSAERRYRQASPAASPTPAAPQPGGPAGAVSSTSKTHG
jgi:hypothetical protein